MHTFLYKRHLFVLLLIFSALEARSQSTTFELRYFTSDAQANGETDFKGETEWFNTEQRVSFLNDYANFASAFFENPHLDRKIVSKEEVDRLKAHIKPQPTTKIRKTLDLKNWRSYGYKEGQDKITGKNLRAWNRFSGAEIKNGQLVLAGTTIEKQVNPLKWRFKVEIRLKVDGNSQFILELKDGQKTAVSLNLRNDLSLAAKGADVTEYLNDGETSKLVVEGDLTQKRFNCYINGKLIHDYDLMKVESVTAITGLSMTSSGKTFIDNLFLFNHIPQEEVRYPYYSEVVLDEDFEEKPAVQGWQALNFDDSHWKVTDLPAVHGGIREKEEYLYLRKKEHIGDFQRAFLQLETLDPGGEVWINNEVVAVVNNRHPQEIEVTGYLKKNQENIIAVRVKPNKLKFPMPHTPTDPYIGWFLGRTKLVLTSKFTIKDVVVNTKSLDHEAHQWHKINLQYHDRQFFEGSIEINYYPWFPEDGDVVASFNRNVKLRPRVANEIVVEFPVKNPKTWSPDSPHLYKVEVILKDSEGNAIDDYVTTTGIRTIEQKNGDLYINGKPEMLNGAQIMGFRTPVETIAKHNRSATLETVAEEMLMIKKMGANLLRVHVHAEKDTTDGINDPRYAEYADQMGIYLIWSTAAFIREGEAWHIDYEGYPKFMQQVINHPSIVLWEASNHPNRFKQHDISETHDFVKTIYQTIYGADKSRLISPTSFWQHTHYANHDGTMDYEGNMITPVPEFNAKMNTRGSQDAYTGYGADWSKLRNAPNDWAASNLSAKNKAYFNFEHEESIGQPNWQLAKGKPWYLIHSYEWGYDEGSIGRRLTSDEWRASQAWQAFSAWESMKKQILLGYDGFSWCSLRGGANMGTYQKPLIDNLAHPKLAYYTNKMAFQRTWAASADVDVVYGPADEVRPVIHHLGQKKTVDLVIELKNLKGKTLDREVMKNIELAEGRNITRIKGFRFKSVKDGVYGIQYTLREL